MSNAQPALQIDQLLKQGIAAARAGDKIQARALLEQVVSLDQYNEKGWFWLAAVADTVHEKTVCLGNVIVINPDNARAQRLLDQLEATPDPVTLPPHGGNHTAGSGVSRKTIILAIGLAALAAVAVLIVLILLLTHDDSGQEATAADDVPVAVVNTPPTTGNSAGDSVEATSIPDPASDQPTAVGVAITLPPTWTPLPSPTAIESGPATPLAPPPEGLDGLIILQSGLVLGDDKNQPIVAMRPDGSQATVISTEGERGHSPVLAPDGSRYIFVKYAPGTRDAILQINNLEGTAAEIVSTLWSRDLILARQDTPAWSPDGRWIAFSAIGPSQTAPDLYRLVVVGSENRAESLQRLTDYASVERWPAFAPDSTRIVYAAELFEDGSSFTELRLLNLDAEPGDEISSLTTNGTALTEAAPDWSPDGQFIVFEARAEGSPDTDIYWIDTAGSAPAEKIIDSDANDIRPRFSPDGRYIVFSSDRSGNWDVFLYEITSQSIFQVTTESHTDIAGDWVG